MSEHIPMSHRVETQPGNLSRRKVPETVQVGDTITLDSFFRVEVYDVVKILESDGHTYAVCLDRDNNSTWFMVEPSPVAPSDTEGADL